MAKTPSMQTWMAPSGSPHCPSSHCCRSLPGACSPLQHSQAVTSSAAAVHPAYIKAITAATKAATSTGAPWAVPTLTSCRSRHSHGAKLGKHWQHPSAGLCGPPMPAWALLGCSLISGRNRAPFTYDKDTKSLHGARPGSTHAPTSNCATGAATAVARP